MIEFSLYFGIIFGGIFLLCIAGLVVINWFHNIIESRGSDNPHYPDFTGR